MLDTGSPGILPTPMRAIWIATTVLLIACAELATIAHGQPSAAGEARIVWEVKNRFRLFRNETDFQRHVAAYRADGVLASEQRLARESDGRGWAREMVTRLCVDGTGRLLETCERDGEREFYLSPQDHRVGVTVAGAVPAGASCAWSFDDGQGQLQQAAVPCDEEVKLRVRYGKPTVAAVDIALGDGTARRVITDIQVRDLLIAGIGDSIAAGDGNPDRPVPLADSGFCFRRFLGTSVSEYFRPGRAGYSGPKACDFSQTQSEDGDWARYGARWMSAACHRSLYSYQMRTAIALAVENPQVAVTFIPLACSGASISDGFLSSQRARECPTAAGISDCAGSVRGQLATLQETLKLAHKQRAGRTLDLVLLTIGANDVNFSGLVADVIVDATTERILFRRGGEIATVEEAQAVIDRELPASFAKLRAALKPFVGGALSRVVFVSYPNPAMQSPGVPCPGGREGFDVHPAFSADPGRLRKVTDFVTTRFLPRFRQVATCESPVVCKDPAGDRMTFVDAHQAAFTSHGFCARSAEDPVFDRDCFGKGETFEIDPVAAATDPMACPHRPSAYRPYASRARWIRTANDSYFAAMTYPEGVSGALRPANIHDATWGVLSAVYGGAVHPTAEGHAAMADAALPAARQVLGLRAPASIRAEPLPMLRSGASQ
jgi:lysophospholipase L1-like esterase